MKKAKSKYESNVEPRIEEIKQWKREYVPDEKIAKTLGIAYSTLREYADKHKALSAALKEQPDLADDMVYSSLLEKCVPHEVEETEVTYGYERDPNTGEWVEIPLMRKVRKKHIDADPRAMALYLAKREGVEVTDENKGIVFIPQKSILKDGDADG